MPPIRQQPARGPDGPLHVDVQQGGDPVVVCVAGRILHDTLTPLAEAFTRVAGGGCPRVVLDLAEVEMCDSSALNLFVQTRAALVEAGGWLRLAGTQPLVGRVLKITNLTLLLPSYATVDEARR